MRRILVPLIIAAALPVLCSCGPQSPDQSQGLITWVAPNYSEEANSQGLSGTAELRVLIQPSGEVGAVEIIKGTQSDDLDEAAIASIHQCEFRPAVKNGRAEEAWLEMKCYFPPNLVEGVPCHDETANPRIVFSALPDYPEMGRRANQEGEVIVKVLVLEDGTVGAAEVMKGPSHQLIEQAAVRAANDCVFEPGVVNCKPVKAFMALPFKFKLKDPS